MTDLRPYLATRYLAAHEVRLYRAPLRAAQLGAEDERTWGQWLRDGWTNTTTGLHQLVYGTTTQLATGVSVPVEVTDPTLAREYLARALVEFGRVYGWPAAEVESRRLAILNAGNAATVHNTIDRSMAFGPMATWPAAKAWYDVANEMQRSAALVSAGEAAGVIRTSATDAWSQARAAAQAATERIDRGLQVAEKTSSGVGLGLGLGLVVLGAGVAAFAFAPELLVLSKGRKR